MSFDPITLALAKPTILDLTQFACNSEFLGVPLHTFNDVHSTLLGVSIQRGDGFAIVVEVKDVGGKLRAAASGNGMVTIRSHANGTVIDAPTVIMRDPEGGAAQIAASALFEMPSVGTVDEKIIIQFSYDNDDVEVIVKGEVVPKTNLT